MRFLPTAVTSATLTAAAAITTIGLAGAASGAAPTRETVHLTRELPSFVSCPEHGFVVKATFDLTREITTFTDASRTPVRRQIHATITGVLSNSVTGYSLPSTGVRNFSFDLVARTSFATGTNTLVHQPGGGGTILLGTGRMQFDDATGQLVDYNGPTDDGEYEALCAALS